jgi:hypothetical protein
VKECLKRRVWASVCNDDVCAKKKFELRSVADDDWVAGKTGKDRGLAAAAQRDNELQIEPAARFCNEMEEGRITSAGSSHGGVDERPAVKPTPWKVHLTPGSVIHERACVEEVLWKF